MTWGEARGGQNVPSRNVTRMHAKSGILAGGDLQACSMAAMSALLSSRAAHTWLLW